MFEIGFGEILLVLAILLLVVGPERLPTVARTSAVWIRKARRFISQVKREVEQELHAEELRQSFEDNKDLLEFTDPNNQPHSPKPGADREKRPDSKRSDNGPPDNGD